MSEIALELEIENHYELYDAVTVRKKVTVPAPPNGDLEDEDWEQENIFAHTGVGHEDGNSSYFVEVLASSDPQTIPVGTEWEFC